MKSWDGFIADITNKEFFQMIKENKQFELEGSIGDCLLRSKAEEYEKMLGWNLSVTIVMRNLVYEGYKRFAEKYFETGEII